MHSDKIQNKRLKQVRYETVKDAKRDTQIKKGNALLKIENR